MAAHFANVKANGVSDAEEISADAETTIHIRGLIAPAFVVGLLAPTDGGNTNVIGVWNSEAEPVIKAGGFLNFQVIGADEAPQSIRDKIDISVTTV